MSQIGVQKAAQLLNILGQQLPAIAQADEMGIDVNIFTRGVLARMGLPQADLDLAGPAVAGLAAIVSQPQSTPGA